MNKKQILITGSGRVEWIKLLCEKVFETNYDTSVEINNEKFHLIQFCDMNTLRFNRNAFKAKCNELYQENDLNAIIMIENLNPRPETLMNDIEILKDSFNSRYLKEKLFIFFTFSNKPISLNELRNGVLEFHSFFNILNCYDINEKNDYVNKQVWILDNEYIKRLKELPFLKSKPLSIQTPIQTPISTQISTPDSIVISGLNEFDLLLKLIKNQYSNFILLKIDNVYKESLEKSFISFFDNYYQTKNDFMNDISLKSIEIDGMHQSELLKWCPLNAFILLLHPYDLKDNFLNASKKIVDSFGSESVKNLIIFYASYNNNLDYHYNEIKSNEGYKYLLNSDCDVLDIKIFINNNLEEFNNFLPKTEFPKSHMKYSIELMKKNNLIETCEKRNNNSKSFFENISQYFLNLSLISFFFSKRNSNFAN